jgi:hypothetical protein
MKKFLPVIMLVLLLTSLKFNASIARLFESNSPGFEFIDINESVPELIVSVYPNPVVDNKINIIASQNIKSIKILTIVGSVIFDEKYEAGITSVEINLDKVSKGLYLLKLEFDKDKIYTEKIMIK